MYFTPRPFILKTGEACLLRPPREEDAEALIELLNRNHPPKNILTACYEPMTGAHVGPGMLAVYFYSETWR